MKEINNYQRFLSGEYCNYLDAEVLEMIVKTQKCLSVLNDITTTDKERKEILSKMLGSIGIHSSIGYNFTCQCGKHIFIGELSLSVHTPKERLSKSGFARTIFANDNGYILPVFTLSKVYRFMTKLPKIFQRY